MKEEKYIGSKYSRTRTFSDEAGNRYTVHMNTDRFGTITDSYGHTADIDTHYMGEDMTRITFDENFGKRERVDLRSVNLNHIPSKSTKLSEAMLKCYKPFGWSCFILILLAAAYTYLLYMDIVDFKGPIYFFKKAISLAFAAYVFSSARGYLRVSIDEKDKFICKKAQKILLR